MTAKGKPDAGWRRSLLSGAIIAGAAWLGLQAALAVVAQRAPTSVAVRFAAASPSVLARAAEAEYRAGRLDNARWLSARALAKAPFDVRSMRVRGLIEARSGRLERADTLITIAGNWSLRDDEAHAWLVEQRLRRGDYSSAFAHADTLARRRPVQRPLIFDLFTTAAGADPRAVPALTARLATQPFWRWDYLESLKSKPDAAPLQATLALSLEETGAPLEPGELEQIYLAWTAQGRIAGLKALRSRLGRPPLSPAVVNSSFETDPAYDPFDWYLATDASVSTIISADDVRGNERALRTERRGGTGGLLTRQLLLLAPGTYVFSGEVRSESDEPSHLRWTVVCFETGLSVLTTPRLQQSLEWRPFSGSVRIPESQCSAQWLRLEALGDDLESDRVSWFDKISVTPAP